jgi:aspartyl-tRNA(Asn)/glutamyl-tRNA(Gln) amidotransferase subunit B
MMNSQWETVIGLEIHTQLATKSKIFSGAATAYGAEPNTQACAVDLGLPGVLPVLNQEAVNMAIKFGLGIDAEIAPTSVFARKNYFYPDLPKGYQISQMDLPIVGKGYVDIEVDGKTKRINVTRAHLEEDAGKSLHEDFHGLSGIDLNRAGTPLLEIVSEPDMRSPKEAIAYAKTIHNLVRWLGISDGNMEEGSFRCDVNVSVRPKGQAEFGTRREIKNLNSFRFMQQAIDFEVDWQIDQIEQGIKIQQATVLFNPNTGETKSMRSKEEANDYRYFPDPDLLPVLIDETLKAQIKANLPELPNAKKTRFIEQYQLDNDTAVILTSSLQLADYYENVVQESACEAKMCANWIVGDLLGALNKASLDITQSPIEAVRLAGLLKRIADNTISGKIAKQIFETLWESKQTTDEVIDAQGLRQITDTGAIAAIIDEIIAANQKQVEQYRSGNEKVFVFFVGQVMKAMQGKGNPAEVNKLLKEKLS